MTNITKFEDLGKEEQEALLKFAEKNGRCWKQKLRDLWMTGQDHGALRRIRNTVGPSSLERLTLPK